MTTGALPDEFGPTHPSEPAKENDASDHLGPGALPGPPRDRARQGRPDQRSSTRWSSSGLCFCAAVMGTDLRHTPVVGGEQGYPDLIARPDLSTMLTLPWEPGVACCLADLEPAEAGAADLRPARRAARRGRAWSASSASSRSSAPSSSSSWSSATPTAPNGVRRHVDNLSMVYTVGPQADPDGLVRRITEQLSAIGLDVFAVNHEFMNSQYEINLRHSSALRRRRPRLPPEVGGQGHRRPATG